MISFRYKITRHNTRCIPVKQLLPTALLTIYLCLLPHPVLAGGGPENVLLVVNRDSPVSLQVANTYVALRDIPQEHVLWLQDIPYPDSISIDTFRTRIWKPIRDFISRHQLGDEIDIIAYSADFPTTVNFTTDLKASKLVKRKSHGKEASLTGLTFFARHVEAGNPSYLTGDENLYFRRILAWAPLLRPLTKAEARLIQEAMQAFKQEDYPTALANYQSLVEGFPEHGGLWYELARAQAATGNKKAAMIALQKAADYGWSDSMKSANDRHLATLTDDGTWQPLLKRMEARSSRFQATQGFNANYEWTGAARPIQMAGDDSLHSYYLAIMLAYTGAHGNSVPEVKNYLAAARASDGTQPDGTVYLLVNNNVRSRTRQPLFPAVVTALENRGHRAEILSRKQPDQDGLLPQGKDDVIGAMAGYARYDWQSSGSKLMPGAIAESLTSFGARFTENSQTKLTELLRYGAAGSSGTVTEPFSIQAKFPTPLMHIFYADGSSLAEAFYQSVQSPYQLLIVGDPLARPYAHFAEVRLISPDPDTPWSGDITLQPKVIAAPNRPIAQLELWVDGQLAVYALPNKPISWDTTGLDDGFHELRLVTREETAVETSSYSRFGVTIANSNHRLEVDTPPQQVRYGKDIRISGTAIKGSNASLWQGSRKLAAATVNDGRWQLQIKSQMLGPGPVSLAVRVTFDDKVVVRSTPMNIDIMPPEPDLKAVNSLPAEAGKIMAIGDNSNEDKPVKLSGRLRNLKKVRHLTMTGQLTVTHAGFYELVVSADGKLSLAIDDHPLLSEQDIKKDSTQFFPLALEQGTHVLKIEFSPAGNKPYLHVMLEGDQIATIPEVSVTIKDTGQPRD